MKHYLALDALRGIAALSILLFHLGHWWNLPGLDTNAYLAVDFFFCLSGFVLALAFTGPKHRDLTLARFTLVRLVRLLPLVVLANVVSAAYLAAKGLSAHADVPWPALGRALILGVLDLPDLTAPSSIGGPQIFPLNGPQYTLFLELVVNVAWFATRRLPQLPFALAVSLISFAMVGYFGSGGDTVATILLGLPRVCASFFAGVALHHALALRPRLALPGASVAFAVLASAMVALFCLPMALPPLAVLVWSVLIVPAIVLAGTGVVVPDRLLEISAGLGALSYPIYALHYPIFCWINGAMQAVLHRQAPWIEMPVVLLGVVAGSAAALTFVDGPVRSRLSGLIRRRDRSGARPARVEHA